MFTLCFESAFPYFTFGHRSTLLQMLMQAATRLVNGLPWVETQERVNWRRMRKCTKLNASTCAVHRFTVHIAHIHRSTCSARIQPPHPKLFWSKHSEMGVGCKFEEGTSVEWNSTSTRNQPPKEVKTGQKRQSWPKADIDCPENTEVVSYRYPI